MEAIKQTPKKRGDKWIQETYFFDNGVKVKLEVNGITELEAHNFLNPNDIWYPIDLRELASDIMNTPLFEPLNNYYNNSPALTIYLEKKYIKSSDVPKLLGQLNQDLAADKIILALYNLIVQRIEDIIGKT